MQNKTIEFLNEKKIKKKKAKSNRKLSLCINIIILFMAFCATISICFGFVEERGVLKIDYFSFLTQLAITFLFYLLVTTITDNHIISYLVLVVCYYFSFRKHMDDIIIGLKMLINDVSNQIGSYYKIDADITSYIGDDRSIDGVEIFMLYFAGLWAIILLMCNRKRIYGFVCSLCIMPWIIGFLITGININLGYILWTTLYFVVCICAGNGYKGKSKKIVYSGFASTLIGVLCWSFLLVSLNTLLPDNFYKNKSIEGIKTSVNKRFERVQEIIERNSEYMKGGIGNGYFDGVRSRVGDTDGVSTTGERELKIDIKKLSEDSEDIEKLYLKGFTASKFSNNTWTAGQKLEEDDIKFESERFYYNDVFSRMYNQLYSWGEDEGSVITVYKYTDTNAVFVPYYSPNLQTSSLYSDMYKRGGAYHSEENPYAVAVKTINPTGDITDFDKLLKKEEDFYYNSDEYMEDGSANIWSYEINGSLPDSFEDAMSYYSDILKDEREECLKLPSEDEMPKFYEEFEHMNRNVGGKDVDLAGRGFDFDIGISPYVNYVIDYLSNYKYNLKPGKVPKGENVVEYFLFEHKEGYCMYFATAATLMFRKMGIPARYCEGYAVNVKGEGKSSLTVYANDTDLHAWVEIYVDSIGWVPVEVTYGANINGEAQNETEVETENQTELVTQKETTTKNTETESTTLNNESKNNKETQTSIKQSEKDEKTNKVKMSKVGKIIGRVFLAVFIIVLICMGVYLSLLYRRKNLTCVNAEKDIIRLLKYADTELEFGKDRDESINKICEKIHIKDETVRQIYDIIDSVMYSENNKLEKSQKKDLKKLMRIVCEKTMQVCKGPKKLYVYYIMDRYK